MKERDVSILSFSLSHSFFFFVSYPFVLRSRIFVWCGYLLFVLSIHLAVVTLYPIVITGCVVLCVGLSQSV